MTRFIEYLIEPQRLLLYWQARESQKRSRFYVGQLLKHEGKVVMEYSTGPEMVLAKDAGFQGYPAFPLKKQVHTHQVMEAFTRRLPPRNRRDFNRYLELRALPANAEISDFALLGYTGAKLPDDGFEVVHPFDKPPPVFQVLIEVAGFRHEADIEVERLQAGYSIQFVMEPDNRADSSAIRIEHEGYKLGYVPRGHLEMFHRMLQGGANLAGEIFRINGTSTRPLVYVLTQIEQCDSLRLQA